MVTDLSPNTLNGVGHGFVDGAKPLNYMVTGDLTHPNWSTKDWGKSTLRGKRDDVVKNYLRCRSLSLCSNARTKSAFRGSAISFDLPLILPAHELRAP